MNSLEQTEASLTEGSGTLLLTAGTDLLAEGERLLAIRHLQEAIELFDRAEAAAADPDRCAGGRWIAFMLKGELESAWLQSDAIRSRSGPDPNRLWRGESLAGKRLIVRCLHGFGDATQFLRYVPQLRALASSLVIEVPPRFFDLARCFNGVDEVITWGPLAPTRSPAWDVQMEVMELPYIFRTQAGELPLATRYLHLPAALPLPSAPTGKLRVGLSRNAGIWDPARAISPQALWPIFAVEGCEFWSLEGGPECEPGWEPGCEPSCEPGTAGVGLPLQSHGPCKQTMQGLAALISQLDLVITVDTLAAHLAGALGVTAWVLLKHRADWRWMHGRTDSPWYPSLTLFRQPAPGAWEGVIATVCEALRNKAAIHQSEAL